MKCGYDRWGNRREEAYFDAEGRRTAGATGIARWTAEYDKYGSMIAQAFFDTQDQPLTLPDGYHRWRAEYDQRGYMISKAFFDRGNQPALSKDGMHRVRGAYDADGRRTKEAYFGSDDRPIAPRDGVAGWTQTFDEAGRIKERRYFGVDDKSIKGPDRYAVEKHEYTEQGNVAVFSLVNIETISYFDEHDKPARHRQGYFKMGSGWATWGGVGVQLSTYFDASNQRIAARDGYWAMASIRDGRGNITFTMFLDKDEQLQAPNRRPKVVHQDNYFAWSAAYDEQNHQTEIAYLGSDLKPVYHRAGYAHHANVRCQREADERDVLVARQGQELHLRSGNAQG